MKKLVDAIGIIKKEVLKTEFNEQNSKYQAELQKSKDEIAKNTENL